MRRWLFIAWALSAALLGGVADAPKSPHWAFQPIRDPAAPAVTQAAWCRTSLDRFLLAPLEARGIQPAPPADRRALIRRATYDLTGLPPTAEEVDAFLADPSPDAWVKRVERLLDSPHYGEHWGRHWLDVVRYADTAGETADYPVPVAWRYRNYVIDAFNTDKPYDEFLREQIAGDLLARSGTRDRYAERVTATGYLALSRRFGFDSENYHHLTIQDTIDTLGQSVLGLTLGCARCHAHKFDPVSMPDYYALYGIFDSTRYAFPGSEQKQKHRALTPLIPPAESQPRWQDFESRIAALAGTLERQKQPAPSGVLRSLDDLDGDFEMQAPAAGGSNGVLVPPWLYEGNIAVTQDTQSPFKNLHPSGKVGASVPSSTNGYRIAQALHPSRTRGRGGVLHLNLDFRVRTNDVSTPGIHRFWLGARPSSPAIEILLATDTVSLRSGDHTQVIRTLRPDQWHNLQLALNLNAGTVSGGVGSPDDLVNFQDLPLSPTWTGTLNFLAFDAADSTGKLRPGLALDNLALQEAPMPSVSTTPQAFALSGDELNAAGADQVKKDLATLLANGPFEMAYAVSEGTPHNARIQRRGEPNEPGEEVPRGFLRVLGGGPLPAETSGSGRLELAQWLTAADNPLTARVMVNRIWQYHFGQGLVKTPNDFGSRGQRPSHPELLDHLATQFIRSGWSVKAMHRLIMNSAVYQQGSQCSVISDRWSVIGENSDCPAGPPTVASGLTTTDSLMTASPITELFSPFPRRRLSAEETRDSILLVTGELDLTPGREHPFPSPTGWGYTQHGPFSAVYDHHRRSVYLMTQRLKRHPFLALFDGADPNASTAERRTTTVPTQALFFLNDPFVHANAEQLAMKTRGDDGTESQQINVVYRRVLGRCPTPAESGEATEFLAGYRAGLVAGGNEKPAPAALAAFVRVLLGSNEFLTVD